MTRTFTAQPLQGVTPAAAIGPGGLLEQYFRGPSWDRWKAVLKAAYAEALTPTEDALFREVAERDPPTRRVKELWCIAGRWSGKDSIASGIAAVAALGDYREHLRPGEVPTILCLASDRDQAGIVQRYICGYFNQNDALRPLVARETSDGLELRNGVVVAVGTNNFRAVRGRTIVLCILDECAFYRSEASASPDTEVYQALRPALARVPTSMLIGISSPYRRAGLLYERWQRHYGRDEDDVLVIRGPSKMFNPKVDQRMIDVDMARDPDKAAAEWLAEWRNDLSDFLDRELVESAVDRGVQVRPPHHQCDYRMFVDSSGGRGDAFAAAVAHAEGDDTVVLDALYERRAPFNPTEAVADVVDLARSYGINRCCGDRYAANWCTEAFAKVGMVYENTTRDRSAIYLDALPLFTSGRIRLLDNPRLIHQFVSLERRVSKFGREAVNHPDYGGSDDLANSAAGAAVLAATDKRPSLIRQSDLLDPSGAALTLPSACEAVIAFVAMNKAGIVAVVYVLISASAVRLPDLSFVRPIFIADFDAGPLGPNLLVDVANRALDLGATTNARVVDQAGNRAVFAYVDPRLMRQAEVSGLAADPIPPQLAGDLDNMFISAGLQIQRGLVKICTPAAEKAKTHPFGGAVDLRGGDREDDALRRAALWAISVTLDVM